MIICADDYGLAEDIDSAIVELCPAGRLSAVSCLTALARCSPGLLRQLEPFRPRLDIGLHLCLTSESEPLETALNTRHYAAQPIEFSALLRRALTGRINARIMIETISLQYDLFVKKVGMPPDYLDGHLHAHQLPGIRQALISFVLSLPISSRPYVRNTRLPLTELRNRGLPWTKAAFIGFFGQHAARAFRAAGIRTNNGFAGIYDFKDAGYAGYLPRFLECLPEPNGILVVHPGKNEPWRRREFAALGDFPFQPGTINRFR